MTNGHTKNGTPEDDFYFVFDGTTEVNTRKGDDHIKFVSKDDVMVDGGFGHDRFDFFVLSTQEFEINSVTDDRTVIKVFEDGERVLKMVLKDVEEIHYRIEKGAPTQAGDTEGW